MQILPDSTKIKRWRDERAWSQEHLADVAGVGVRTVQRIEKGEGASRESLMALAAAFDVNVIDLTRDAHAETLSAVRAERAKGRAALRLSFIIHFASYIFGMFVFAVISMMDGGEGFSMLAPALWWTVGVAGHGLTVVIVEAAMHFKGEG